MCPHLRFLQLVARGGRRACRLLSAHLPFLIFKCPTYIALAANHLVAVELGGKSLERGLNDTTAEAEDQVEGRLLQTQRPVSWLCFFDFEIP